MCCITGPRTLTITWMTQCPHLLMSAALLVAPLLHKLPAVLTPRMDPHLGPPIKVKLYNLRGDLYLSCLLWVWLKQEKCTTSTHPACKTTSQGDVTSGLIGPCTSQGDVTSGLIGPCTSHHCVLYLSVDDHI